MFDRKPPATGQFTSAIVSEDSPAPIGPLAGMDMREALSLAEGERVDVTEPGLCLVEVPDGTRFVMHLKSGSFTGPVRLLQIHAPITARMIAAAGRDGAPVWTFGSRDALYGALILQSVALCVLPTLIPMTFVGGTISYLIMAISMCLAIAILPRPRPETLGT
ncbi:hypothetical protein OCH239_09735 [Roseivivax halodurans JCM 10272]|uniref:Uncharacterized protein n=1 Tax=Roseivivax halodurans JCM 10272 TaxID=1449350 RepID=X7ECF6_9RHOB|nr:hypothetical protein [Roseivivax halodurans]ETX13550.1 hypothetical protein OCH239_09735 [Roseivivax halodurans JCM 10272]